MSGSTTPRPWSRARARAFDAYAQNVLRVRGEVLMENAGAAVARHALEMVGTASCDRVVVVAGSGNNGGDGLVAARQLLGAVPVAVWMRDAITALRGDALEQTLRFKSCGGELYQAAEAADLRAALAHGAPLVLDALFGIGLARPLDATWCAWIEACNALGAPILAVDVPSGLDADEGRVLGAAIRAKSTLTFVAPKLGFTRGAGPAHTGEVHVAGIGVPVAPFVAEFPHDDRPKPAT